MTRAATFLILAAALALAACERAPAPDAANEADAPATAAVDDAAAGDTEAGDAEDFERVWLGVLPCADCDGIQTRLQLVRDGGAQTYEIEETYLGAEEGEAVFSQKGRWVQDGADGDATRFQLDPETPGGRRYALQPDGALEQLDGRGEPIGDDGQYVLQRL